MIKKILNICAFMMLMCWPDTSRAGACCGKEKDNDEKKPILTKQKTHINGEKKEDRSPLKKKKISTEVSIINTSSQLQHAGLNILVPEGYEKRVDTENNAMLVYPKICHITLLVCYKKSKNEDVKFLLEEKGARPDNEKLLKRKLEVVREDLSQNNSTETSNHLSICFEQIMNTVIEKKKPVYLARDPKDQSSIILVLEKDEEEAAGLLFETIGTSKKEKKEENATTKKKKKKKPKKRKKNRNSSSDSSSSDEKK